MFENIFPPLYISPACSIALYAVPGTQPARSMVATSDLIEERNDNNIKKSLARIKHYSIETTQHLNQFQNNSKPSKIQRFIYLYGYSSIHYCILLWNKHNKDREIAKAIIKTEQLYG
jgi:hypothetical protein